MPTLSFASWFLLLGTAALVSALAVLPSLPGAPLSSLRKGEPRQPCTSCLTLVVTFRRYRVSLDPDESRRLTAFLARIAPRTKGGKVARIAAVRLLGHSDCRETMQQRDRLSRQRARTIRHLLVEAGVPRRAIEWKARGCSLPLGTKKRPLFRYVQLVVKPVTPAVTPKAPQPSPRPAPQRPKPQSDPVPIRR